MKKEVFFIEKGNEQPFFDEKQRKLALFPPKKGKKGSNCIRKRVKTAFFPLFHQKMFFFDEKEGKKGKLLHRQRLFNIPFPKRDIKKALERKKVY